MKRSLEWQCERCQGDSTGDLCLNCDWPRAEKDDFRASELRDDDEEQEHGANDEKQARRAPANADWVCGRCETATADEFVACGGCGEARWTEESFDGRSYWVTRTQLDHDLDCSAMRRLHWQQLLCPPPGSGEWLVALFASGLVDDEAEAEAFSRQFFPPSIHAWLVAQDCRASVGGAEAKHAVLSGAEQGAEREIDGASFGVSWRAMFFKPLSGLMHAKLYLFRFTNTLRVVVCSANPTCMSWSFQRECIWVQDFPVLRNAQTHRLEAAAVTNTEFGVYLQTVLSHMRVSLNCLRTFGLDPKMLSVDFSGANARLIASCPGQWSQKDVQHDWFGLMRLRTCVREAGWLPEFNSISEVYCQSGSIGGDMQRETFFQDLEASLGGASLFERYDPGAADSSEDAMDRSASNPLQHDGDYPANFFIFFPSKAIGRRNSRLYERFKIAREADVYCSVPAWHSKSYPSQCFRDVLHPKRLWDEQPAPFLHSKFILRRRIVSASNNDDEAATATSTDKKCVAFLYVGSHNLSKTAWGYRSGKSKDLLRCNSLELGVFLSTDDAIVADAWCRELPFDLTARRYCADDVPFSTHRQHQTLREHERYMRSSVTDEQKRADLLKLGFAEEEVTLALARCGGDAAAAFAMMRMARHME